jgi:plasmid stability protein
MNAITIRNLSDEASRALEARAVRNGTTAEAEIEQILEELLVSKEPAIGLGTALRQLGEKYGGLDDVDFSRDQAPARGVSFE